MINNHQLITETSSTTPWNDLLLEIAQTPEEYIPEILEIIRLFRQNLINKPTTSINTEKHKYTHQNDLSNTKMQFNQGSCKTNKEIFIGHFHLRNLKLPIIHNGWFAELPMSEYPNKICFAFFSFIKSIN